MPSYSAEAPPKLQVQDRQRDRDARPALHHLVEVAVSRIIVIIDVAAETHLAEQVMMSACTFCSANASLANRRLIAAAISSSRPDRPGRRCPGRRPAPATGWPGRGRTVPATRVPRSAPDRIHAAAFLVKSRTRNPSNHRHAKYTTLPRRPCQLARGAPGAGCREPPLLGPSQPEPAVIAATAATTLRKNASQPG